MELLPVDHSARVVQTEHADRPLLGHEADGGTHFLHSRHERKREQRRSKGGQPEGGPDLRIGGDAERGVVTGPRNQARTQILPEAAQLRIVHGDGHSCRRERGQHRR